MCCRSLLIVKWNKNDFFYLIFFYYCSHRLILSFQISFSRTVFWNCQDLSRGLDIYRRLFHPGDLTQPLPCYYLYHVLPLLLSGRSVLNVFLCLLLFHYHSEFWCFLYQYCPSLLFRWFFVSSLSSRLWSDTFSAFFYPEILGRIATSRWNDKFLNKCL